MLADDLELIRVGIRSILSAQPGVEVVGEASTGEEAVEVCRRLRPDLVLMDIEMPGMDGISATREIKRELPSTVVLMLTVHDEPEYLLDAVRAGAAGYLLKENAFQRVPGAVRRIINGESPLDQELAMQLLQRISEDQKPSAPQDDASARKSREKVLGDLTGREREILSLIVAGRSNQQIAEELYLSVGTVKTHVHRIISKLGVSDRTQAAVLAIRLGLVSP